MHLCMHMHTLMQAHEYPCKHTRLDVDHLGQHGRGGSLLICNFHVKVGKHGHLVIKLFSCY